MNTRHITFNNSVKFPRNFNDVTDKDIFDALDPKFPGLEKVIEKYRKGNIEGARHELVLYFKSRQCVKWEYDYREINDDFTGTYDYDARHKGLVTLPVYLVGYSTKDADNLLKKDYRLSRENYSGDGADLFFVYDATSEVDNKPPRVKANRFVRMNFINTMINAYYSTGNKEYAMKLAEILEAFFGGFLEKYPYVFDEVPEIEYSFHFQQNPMRTNMSVGHSVLRLTNLLYTSIPYMDEFPEEITFKIIKFIWYLTMFHKLFEKNKYRYYNHHLFERGINPFTFSVTYPEFPVIRNMRQRAIQVIQEHVEKDFNEDGGYDEHSMSYFVNTTMSEFFIPAYEFASRNKVVIFEKEHIEKINKSFDLLCSVIMPDGKLPDIGDAGGANGIEILSKGRDLFKNKKCDAALKVLGLSSGEADRSNLSPLYGNYPYSGYFAARDKWSQQSNYFVMSNKMYTRPCGHNHLDMLSLIINVGGETIIGEPMAPVLYKSVSHGSKLDDYLRGGGAHSTVFIHGQPITKKYLEDNNTAKKQTVHTSFVQEKDGKVFVSAFHEAYQNCRHTREVLFKHNTGWIVKDMVETDVHKEKPHIQRWHFEDGVKVSEITKNSVLVVCNNAKLLCIWPDREDIVLKLWKNEDVLLIERGKAYPDINSLPYVLDVAFAGGTGEGKVKLACMLLDVSELPNIPDAGCYEKLLMGIENNKLAVDTDF